MTDTNNPYEAPESSLTSEAEHAGGSLEKGLSGDYHFEIGAVISKAWSMTKGYKRTLLGAYGILILVNIAFSALGIAVAGNGTLTIILNIISFVVAVPLNAGVFMLGIHRAAGRPVQAMQITGYYGRTLELVLFNIVMILMIVIGFVLLVIPGIYLSIAYIFALPLVVDKKMGIWAALEASRKTITHKWFKFFGLFFVLGLMVILSSIPALIGLIWVLPLASLVVGVLYVDIMGLEAE